MARLDWQKAAARDRGRIAGREPVSWWWTLNGRAGRCALCATPLPYGVVMAYNHDTRQRTCERCARSAGLNPAPSKRYEAYRAEQRRKKTQATLV